MVGGCCTRPWLLAVQRWTLVTAFAQVADRQTRVDLWRGAAGDSVMLRATARYSILVTVATVCCSNQVRQAWPNGNLLGSYCKRSQTPCPLCFASAGCSHCFPETFQPLLRPVSLSTTTKQRKLLTSPICSRKLSAWRFVDHKTQVATYASASQHEGTARRTTLVPSPCYPRLFVNIT